MRAIAANKVTCFTAGIIGAQALAAHTIVYNLIPYVKSSVCLWCSSVGQTDVLLTHTLARVRVMYMLSHGFGIGLSTVRKFD